MSQDFYWQLAEENPEAIVWDEYVEAYLGVGNRQGMKPVAVYDMRVLQGIVIEDLIGDIKLMDELAEKHQDNEESLTSDIIRLSKEFMETQIFTSKGSDGENAPIFLDIPYIDSRYETMEEE